MGIQDLFSWNLPWYQNIFVFHKTATRNHTFVTLQSRERHKEKKYCRSISKSHLPYWPPLENISLTEFLGKIWTKSCYSGWKKFQPKRQLNQHQASCKGNPTESELATTHSDWQISIAINIETNEYYKSWENFENFLKS